MGAGAGAWHCDGAGDTEEGKGRALALTGRVSYGRARALVRASHSHETRAAWPSGGSEPVPSVGVWRGIPPGCRHREGHSGPWRGEWN